MQKKKKKRNTFSRVIGQASLLLVGAYLVTGILVNHVKISEKQQELDANQFQLEQQLEKNDELDRVLKSGSDLEIIERVARDKYGYAKPNERVFVDVAGQ